MLAKEINENVANLSKSTYQNTIEVFFELHFWHKLAAQNYVKALFS